MNVLWIRRFSLPCALFTVIALSGCDKVKEIVGSDDADTSTAQSAPANTTPTTQTPTTQPQQNQQPVQQQAAPPADPAQVLAAFKALQPQQITDDALKKVADVPAAAAQIGEIDMHQSGVTGIGLGYLAKFPALHTVNLNQALRIKAGEFQVLSNVKTLQVVHVSQTHINGPDLAAICQLPTLKVLSLMETKNLSLQDFGQLQNARQLLGLDIAKTMANDAVTPVLASLPLIKLDIYNTGLSDQGIAQLAKIASLQELNVSYTQVTGVGFSAFRNHNLKILAAGGTRFGVEGLQAIKGMKNLESLNLYQANVIGTLKQMNVFGTFPNLKHLNLGKNGVSDIGLKSLFSRCRQLETLNISHHQNVSDAGIAFLKNLKNLKEINLGNTRCTQAAVAFLQKEIPGIKVTGLGSQ